MNSELMQRIIGTDVDVFFQASGAMENIAIEKILCKNPAPDYSCCDRRHFLDMMFLMREHPEDDKYQVSDLVWQLGERTTVKTIRKYQLNAFDSMLLSVVIAKHAQLVRQAQVEQYQCNDIMSYGPETKSVEGKAIRAKMEMDFDSLKAIIHTIKLKAKDLADGMGRDLSLNFWEQVEKSLRRFSTTTLEIIEEPEEEEANDRKRKKKSRASHHYTRLMNGFIDKDKGEIIFTINPILVKSCLQPGNYIQHPLDVFRNCDKDAKILLLQLFIRKQKSGEKRFYSLDEIHQWIYGDVSEQEKDEQKCRNSIYQQRHLLKKYIKELCGIKFGDDGSSKHLGDVENEYQMEIAALHKKINMLSNDARLPFQEELDYLKSDEGHTRWIMDWTAKHGILLTSVIEKGGKVGIVVQRPFSLYEQKIKRKLKDGIAENILRESIFSNGKNKRNKKSIGIAPRNEEISTFVGKMLLKIEFENYCEDKLSFS